MDKMKGAVVAYFKAISQYSHIMTVEIISHTTLPTRQDSR
jgi:hypothetical protein